MDIGKLNEAAAGGLIERDGKSTMIGREAWAVE
jgi:hypothetical protein